MQSSLVAGRGTPSGFNLSHQVALNHGKRFTLQGRSGFHPTRSRGQVRFDQLLADFKSKRGRFGSAGVILAPGQEIPMHPSVGSRLGEILRHPGGWNTHPVGQFVVQPPFLPDRIAPRPLH